MKKSIICILVCLCLVSTFFVGCKLHTKDTQKINNEVAIRVGDEVITREELTNAYNNYYNYYSQYGSWFGVSYTEEEIFDIAVNSLVNQKLGVQVAKQEVVITEEDFDAVIDAVRSSVKSEIDSKEKTIIEAKGEKLPDRLSDSEEEKKDEATPYAEYTPSYVKELAQNEVAFSEENQKAAVAEYIEELLAECKEYETRLAALNNYISELVQVDMLNGKMTSKTDALKNQIDKLVKSELESKYIEKLQEKVKAEIELSDEDMIAKFNELVDKEKQTYVGDTFVDAFEVDVKENKNLYLYYGYSNQDEEGEETEKNGYIFVQHLLVQFSDEVKAELAKLPGYGIGEQQYRYYIGQAWLDAGHLQDDADTPAYAWFPETDEEKNTAAAYMPYEEWLAYNDLRETYVGTLETTYLDPETGKKVVDEQGNELTKTLNEVLAEIQEVIDMQAEDGETQIQLEARKAQAFKKLMYIYSSDTAMFSIGKTVEVMGYYLPEDQTKLSSSLQSTSGYVGEFVVGTYKLYNSGELVNGQKVFSDYGVHVMLYLGSSKPGAICESNIAAMRSTLLSKSYGETVYDYVATKLYEEKESTAYSEYLAEKKQTADIEYVIDSYKKL